MSKFNRVLEKIKYHWKRYREFMWFKSIALSGRWDEEISNKFNKWDKEK